MTNYINVTVTNNLNKPKHTTVKVMSKNNIVECHATFKEAQKIDEFLMFCNKNVYYKNLYSYVKADFPTLDHVFVSAYLKSKGYSSSFVKLQNNKRIKLWNK